MKNLLIHTGPNGFNTKDTTLAKIQIDNSLELGWKKEELLLVTDFPFEYNGVKSLVVPSGLYYDFDLLANKSLVLVYLLKNNLLGQDLYWCHDLDAFQNESFTEDGLGLTGFDLGLTHYTYKPEWQFGSLFFRPAAQDILELLDTTIRARPHLSRNNEKTLTWLVSHGKIDSQRYKRLNVTYNIMEKYITTIYNSADKPLRIVHFSPWKDDALQKFMYGKNRLKIPLMSPRLIKIFNHHGIH